MKLSKTQQEVINKMKDGWELGRTTMGLYSPRCWLQKGGLGKGGPTIDVSWATVKALHFHHQLISQIEDFPTIRYKLTQKGVNHA